MLVIIVNKQILMKLLKKVETNLIRLKQLKETRLLKKKELN